MLTLNEELQCFFAESLEILGCCGSAISFPLCAGCKKEQKTIDYIIHQAVTQIVQNCVRIAFPPLVFGYVVYFESGI